MRAGRGSAHAAISILNATATGIGCSLAIEGGVEATWEWSVRPGLRTRGTPDDRLVEAVRRHMGNADDGADVTTQATFPPSRGLKTSSSAAAALLEAAANAKGRSLGPGERVTQGVAVCRAAGVTLTGALDDQAAVTLGGCHLTDNKAGRILASIPIASHAVAIWVPDAAIQKQQAAAVDATVLRPDVEALPALVRAGRLGEALTRNGAAFVRVYAAAGLPVDNRPVEVALAAGADGAGLSGTGPAVAALFSRPVDLPQVPGGTWAWSRTVAFHETEVSLP